MRPALAIGYAILAMQGTAQAAQKNSAPTNVRSAPPVQRQQPVQPRVAPIVQPRSSAPTSPSRTTTSAPPPRGPTFSPNFGGTAHTTPSTVTRSVGPSTPVGSVPSPTPGRLQLTPVAPTGPAQTASPSGSNAPPAPSRLPLNPTTPSAAPLPGSSGVAGTTPATTRQQTSPNVGATTPGRLQLTPLAPNAPAQTASGGSATQSPSRLPLSQNTGPSAGQTYIQSGTGAVLTDQQIKSGTFPPGTYFIQQRTGAKVTPPNTQAAAPSGSPPQNAKASSDPKAATSSKAQSQQSSVKGSSTPNLQQALLSSAQQKAAGLTPSCVQFVKASLPAAAAKWPSVGDAGNMLVMAKNGQLPGTSFVDKATAVKGNGIKPGDVLIWNSSYYGGLGHVALVTGVDKTGTQVTVSQRNFPDRQGGGWSDTHTFNLNGSRESEKQIAGILRVN